MGYISVRKNRLQAQLTRVQANLETIYSTLSEAFATNTSSYKFDSGEGSQSVTRKSTQELYDLRERLEAEEAHLINELYNIGLVTVQLRRKTPWAGII